MTPRDLRCGSCNTTGSIAWYSSRGGRAIRCCRCAAEIPIDRWHMWQPVMATTAAAPPVGETRDGEDAIRAAAADVVAAVLDEDPPIPRGYNDGIRATAEAALRRHWPAPSPPPSQDGGEQDRDGRVTPLARIRELSIHGGEDDLTQLDSFTYSWHRGHETLRADGVNYSGVFHPGDGCCHGNPCRYCGRAFYDEEPSDA